MKFSVVILARAAAKSKPCAAFICRKPAPDELDAIAGDLMDRVRKLGEGQE